MGQILSLLFDTYTNARSGRSQNKQKPAANPGKLTKGVIGLINSHVVFDGSTKDPGVKTA